MHVFSDKFPLNQAKNLQITRIQVEKMPNATAFPKNLSFFSIFFPYLKKETGYHKIVITGLKFPNCDRRPAI